MVLINPILLAGPDQVLKYQEKRIEEWTERNGGTEETRIDFENYFAEIVEQWEMDDFNETSIDIDQFKSEEIDLEVSINIQKELKKANLLSPNGFINLKEINHDAVLNALEDFPGLSNEQKEGIANIINNIQENKPIDFETFSKSMFTYTPSSESQQPYTISESDSHHIWGILNTNNIIDDYGVLLFSPKSNELSSAINNLNGINSFQKERVISILNQHPELSYHSYINRFETEPDASNPLPGAGIYFADGVPIKKDKGLTKNQLNYIKIMAVLEWNIMLISQKTIHKSRKKSMEKIKTEKKKDTQENEKHLAELQAKYKAKNKKQTGKKK